MKIYQIQIALKGFKPKIWRRVLVQPDLYLNDLHRIIQTAMGWTNSHLHQFVKGRDYYMEKRDDDAFWDAPDCKDYKNIKISDLLKKEKDKIVYEYDFGDSWEHDIILEKILPKEESTYYPVCVKGKMNCPPEDCGGIWGYADLLETIKDPKNEEYEEMMEWLGDDFDPEYFDLEEINELLKEKDYGCYSFF